MARLRPVRSAARPVRAVQLDAEDDAALLRYCRRRGLTLSEALRELIGSALRAAGAGGLSRDERREREVLRAAKRELLSALASAELER